MTFNPCHPQKNYGEVRITWDTTIYTDKVLQHNRPDITLVHKETQKWTLIDIAVPADKNITRTQEKKVEEYQELAFEIRRIHGASKVTIIRKRRRLISTVTLLLRLRLCGA